MDAITEFFNLPRTKDEWLILDHKISGKCAIAARDDNALGGLRSYMKMMEWTVHGIPWIFGTVALIIFSSSDKAIQFLANLFVALLLDLVVSGTIKGIVQRKRPAYNNDDMMMQAPVVDKFSFPSGHTSRASMLATILLGMSRPAPPVLTVMVVNIFPPVLGASRVMLGRHYISDIIAGLLLGYFEGILMLLVWMSPELAQSAMYPIKGLVG